MTKVSSILAGSFLGLIYTSCASTTPPEAIPIPDPRAHTTTEKATDNPLIEEQDIAIKTKPNKRQLLQFILRLSNTSEPLTEEDRGLISQIDRERLNTFEEGAVIISTLRSLKEDLEKVMAAKGPEAIMESPLLSRALEQELGPFKISLENALNRNVAIKNPNVYKMVLDIIEHTADIESYKTNIKAVIRDEAQKWASLLSSSYTEQPLSSTESESNSTNSQTTEYDLKKSDSLLLEADSLADMGQFRKAIEQVSQIGQSDPLYSAAEEKIKGLSNTAVQILRQKAAQAFQDAIPSDDPNTRVAYLEQARSYLEEALRDFPKSDQLATVSENLRVITADLQKYQPPQTSDEEKDRKEAKEIEGKPVNRRPDLQPSPAPEPQIYE